jgi:hypothetical protein
MESTESSIFASMFLAKFLDLSFDKCLKKMFLVGCVGFKICVEGMQIGGEIVRKGVEFDDREESSLMCVFLFFN